MMMMMMSVYAGSINNVSGSYAVSRIVLHCVLTWLSPVDICVDVHFPQLSDGSLCSANNLSASK